MQWDLYGRVVDNFGDVGVAWRLAADLAQRGESVRLALDDASALAWLAPRGAARVETVGWNDGPSVAPDVVVGLFGAGLPEAAAMAASSSQAPVFVNLEHLSAETYVERSHGLPSPRPSPDGTRFTTWFFYPGFGPHTGGLLREPGLLDARRTFGDGDDWLAARGIDVRHGERRVGVFGYRNDAMPALLDALAATPTLLLLTPCATSAQIAAALGPTLTRGSTRARRLPFLAQADFDRLLWSCDLNLVRGEDSLVRAVWAGVPFVWQLYAQDDGAHRAKLEAFLDRFLVRAPAALAAPLRSLFAGWNGAGALPIELLRPASAAQAEWAAHCLHWRDRLAAEADLVTRLGHFVASKR